MNNFRCSEQFGWHECFLWCEEMFFSCRPDNPQLIGRFNDLPRSLSVISARLVYLAKSLKWNKIQTAERKMFFSLKATVTFKTSQKSSFVGIGGREDTKTEIDSFQFSDYLFTLLGPCGVYQNRYTNSCAWFISGTWEYLSKTPDPFYGVISYSCLSCLIWEVDLLKTVRHPYNMNRPGSSVFAFVSLDLQPSKDGWSSAKGQHRSKEWKTYKCPEKF